MEIEVFDTINGERVKLLESFYSYMERDVDKDGKIRFFISTDGGKNSGYDIYFTCTQEEVDHLIKDLQTLDSD